MELETINKIFKENWKPGWGSVDAFEMMYIQSLIEKHKPKSFVEVGMASGLSGGLISSLLDENGGKLFVTLDHDNTFFGDKSKKNGFLIDKIYSGDKIEVQKRPFTTALDLYKLEMTFDMAFVDANHQHPWPIIDTLCLFPFMTGSKIVIHHDLRLFRKQDVVFGIGPKYLYDQFPPSHRNKSDANEGNIFSVNLDLDKRKMEEIAADAFSLPWSLRTPLTEKYLNDIREIIKRDYSPDLLNIFEASAKKFNVLDRFRSGL